MTHSAFWEVVHAINIADALDIAVVSIFIYSILLWFEWTKAAFVARGILILCAFYIFASQVGMVLTTWIFHGFFAVFAIALVIIFQEEIRRFFERLALWRFRNMRSAPLRSEQVEILLQSASHYAREHIGALLVLKGRDPLERHIDGGVELDGQLSGPLLQSIFDVHSEGHDGAVVLENERVFRFGVHLPLSKNLERLVGVGTRHAAALGISEVTDALAIVVSEQRGTISVARNGLLQPISDLHELETVLNDFLAPKKVAAKVPFWIEFLTKNKIEKLSAVGIALGLWLILVQGFKPETKSFDVNVQVQNVAEGLRVNGISRKKVAVTLGGLKRDLDMVSEKQMKVVLNAEGDGVGTQRFFVSDENVKLPPGRIRYVKAEPTDIEVDLRRVVVNLPEPAPPKPAETPVANP